MRSAGRLVVLILGAALVVAGCGGELTTREKGTFGGAALGAATGAIVGAAVGSPGTGAAIGAGVGAISGTLVGGAMQEQERKAEAQPPQASAPPPPASAGAPPQFAVVPGTPVYYAPTLPQNYFFYGGQYYLFQEETWYSARGTTGGWIVIALEAVPQPILRVPVEYYKRPPGHWKRGGPPPWAPAWGYRRKGGDG